MNIIYGTDIYENFNQNYFPVETATFAFKICSLVLEKMIRQ